ncbi:1412_t:CDS:1, partial [Ambispora leptoticha]
QNLLDAMFEDKISHKCTTTITGIISLEQKQATENKQCWHPSYAS